MEAEMDLRTEHRSVSLADQIFERLEKDILVGKFERGEILTEMKLSEMLGVSRTAAVSAKKHLAAAFVTGNHFFGCLCNIVFDSA